MKASSGVRARTPPHAGMVLAVGLVVLLSVSAIAPAAVAQSNETVNETTERQSVNETLPQEGPHTLEELRRGGRQIPGADPSSRWLGQTGSVFVDYPNTAPLSPQAEEWEVENVLSSDAVVRADELTFNARRDRGAPDKRYIVKVVSYSTKEVQVKRGNTTTTETVAVDQRVNEHDVSFSGAFGRQTIDLENTDGESRKVAMWLETPNGEPVDGARWTFEHESTPTSADAGIGTMGDLFSWVGLWVLLPGFVGIPAAIWGADRIHDRTGRGPMLPGVLYAGAGFMALFMILLFAWFQMATLISALPFLLGASMVAVAFVGYLEYGGNDVVRALFVRDELMDSVSPSGEHVHDIRYEEHEDVRLVRVDEDGRYVVLRKGLRPFLARLFGLAPVLDISELKTEIRAEGDKYERVYVADPEASDPLDYEPPKLSLSLVTGSDDDRDDQDDSSRVVEKLGTLTDLRWSVFIVTGLFGWFGWHGMNVIGLPGLGMVVGGSLGFVLTAVKVDDGHAEFVPAPTHYLAARPQVLRAAADLSDSRTIDELEDIALEAQATTALEARDIQSRMDRTVSERMTEHELGLSADDDRDDGDEPVPEPEEESEEELPVVRDD